MIGQESPEELGESYEPGRVWMREYVDLVFKYDHHTFWHCPTPDVEHDYEACIAEHPCDPAVFDPDTFGCPERRDNKARMTGPRDESAKSQTENVKTESDHIHNLDGCDHGEENATNI
jgi:hypothetical protein